MLALRPTNVRLRTAARQISTPSANVAQMLDRMNSLLSDAAKWASKVRPRTVLNDPPQWAAGSSPSPLGVLDRVYANRAVDLANIDAIGFDYDHTLVWYRKNLNSRIYSLALERLIKTGYPATLSEVCQGFDAQSVIRGLAVDNKSGVLVKLSAASRVVRARRGHEWLDGEEIASLFGVEGALPKAIRDHRLTHFNDLYALATASLVSDVVEFHARAGQCYEPRCVVADVLAAIGHVHSSFAIHKEVLASLPSSDLVSPVPRMRELLVGLRAAGKTLFIVSNSPLWYLEPQVRPKRREAAINPRAYSHRSARARIEYSARDVTSACQQAQRPNAPILASPSAADATLRRRRLARAV